MSLEDIFARTEASLVPATYQPAPPKEGCCWDIVPHDILALVISRLPNLAFWSFSMTCRRVHQISGAVFVKCAKRIQAFLEMRLARANLWPMPFPTQSVSVDLSLGLSRVRSVALARQYPTISKLDVRDAQTAKKHLFQLLLGAQKLVSLSLWHLVHIQDADLGKMPFAPTLKECRFLGAPVGDMAVSRVLRMCPLLETLSLHNTGPITFEGFRRTQIRKLELFGVKIDDQALGRVLSSCPQVTTLSLMSCGRITGSSITHLEFLEELNISNTDVVGAHFIRILEGANRLASLNVSHCGNITTLDFRNATYPPTLKKMIATWTDIDNEGLLSILKTCRLERYDFSDTLVELAP